MYRIEIKFLTGRKLLVSEFVVASSMAQAINQILNHSVYPLTDYVITNIVKY